MSDDPKPKKNSSVRHTRAIQRDRSKQELHGPPSDDIQKLLEQIVSPITYSQTASYRAMGLRQRILNLPVMMAFVLSLIWRHVGSVTDAIRELNQRGILWAKPTVVSQQAVSERLRSFPPELFRQVLLDILPQMQQRWMERKRPLSAVMQWATQKFAKVLILDGSTLDALLRKVGLLREGEGTVLAGRMGALLNAASMLAEELWYEEDSQPKGVLLLFDLGFVNYGWFDYLTDQAMFFVTVKRTQLPRSNGFCRPAHSFMTRSFGWAVPKNAVDI
jgi:hypothetical protein